MKFNVHLLLHLPETVEDFGSLWAWSAFPYEGYNFVLRSMLKNSQCIVQQVCKSYLRLQNIKSCNFFEMRGCNDYGKRLFCNLVGAYKTKRTGQTRGYGIVTLGLPKEISLNLVEKLCIQRVIPAANIDVDLKFQIYERFICNGIVCNSCEYNSIEKRNNSVIKLNDNEILLIKGLLKIVNADNEETWLIIGKQFQATNETFCS